MIYTSYFAKFTGINGVSISRGAKWWDGEKYIKLAPPAELLAWWKFNSRGSAKDLKEKWGAFTKVYREQVLDKLDVHQVARELDGKVLLCFEKTKDYCHRHIVRDWLNENGYECREL